MRNTTYTKIAAMVAPVVALLPALAAAPTAACFPQGQCDPSVTEYCATGDVGCAGHLIDPYTWQSGPIDGAWLDFPHERTWTMHFRDAVTGAMLQGTPYEYKAFISPVVKPSDGSQFAEAGGNLAEWSVFADSTHVNVLNDTCADYFLFVVVHASPDGAAPDAGGDASQDATTE